jgi:hypothetical protein
MTDNKQFQQVQEATWDMVNSFREANRTLADSVMTMQDHNLRFTQGLFLSWREVLTPQTQSTPRLQSWKRPTQKQQDAFHKLPSTKKRSMDGNQSEVATLRARLDRECESYSLFFNGFAMTASHTAITKRMEAMSLSVEKIQTALVPLVGEKEAIKIVGVALQEEWNNNARLISAKTCAG